MVKDFTRSESTTIHFEVPIKLIKTRWKPSAVECTDVVKSQLCPPRRKPSTRFVRNPNSKLASNFARMSHPLLAKTNKINSSSCETEYEPMSEEARESSKSQCAVRAHRLDPGSQKIALKHTDLMMKATMTRKGILAPHQIRLRCSVVFPLFRTTLLKGNREAAHISETLSMLQRNRWCKKTSKLVPSPKSPDLSSK